VDFASQHNMKVRGHCFVWHQQVPKWLTTGITNHEYDETALNQILRNHIAIVAQHYSGKVWAWDVVNEAFNADGTMRSTIWYDAPGIGLAGQGTAYIEQALRWAHAADPKAELFYNDYDTEALNAKSDAIYAMAKDFHLRGVPLNGIGFQTHVNLKFDDPKALFSFAANLKRFSDLGMDIHTPNSTSPSMTTASRVCRRKVSSTAKSRKSVCRILPAVFCRPGVSPTNTRGFPATARASRAGRYPSMLRIRKSPPTTEWCTRSKPGDSAIKRRSISTSQTASSWKFPISVSSSVNSLHC